MRKLLVIPFFFLVIGLTYVAMWFVELNRDEIVVHLGPTQQTNSTAIGFVILTSTLIGMVISGFLCSIEMLALLVQNRKLKRRIQTLAPKTPKKPDATTPVETPDSLTPRATGRFT